MHFRGTGLYLCYNWQYCMWMWLYICVCECIHVNMYEYVCLSCKSVRAGVCVFPCVCVHVCVSVFLFTHVHDFTYYSYILLLTYSFYFTCFSVLLLKRIFFMYTDYVCFYFSFISLFLYCNCYERFYSIICTFWVSKFIVTSKCSIVKSYIHNSWKSYS